MLRRQQCHKMNGEHDAIFASTVVAAVDLKKGSLK